jgi:hypothetical protein
VREICLIFEDDYEDCDIICVSDFIADNAARYGQLFCDFLANTTDESYFVDISGKKYLSCETEGFIRWLNKFYCETNEKSYIVKQHTSYILGYTIIEF